MTRKGNIAALFILFAFIIISANSNVFESIDFYSPDENIKTRTKVKIEDKIIDATSTLKITLKPSGGQAIHLTPL